MLTTPGVIVITTGAFTGGGIAGAFLALRQPLRDAVAKGYALSVSVRLGPPAPPKPAVPKAEQQHGAMSQRHDPGTGRFASKAARDTGEAA